MSHRGLAVSFLLCATVTDASAQSLLHEWRSDPIPPETWFGYRHSVASVGDLDGDGVRDVVIGESQAGQGSPLPTGRFRAYSGRTGVHLYTVSGDPNRFEVAALIAPLSDLDGDGIADFAAWNWTSSRYAWIACSGRDGSTIRLWFDTQSVCRAPDVDGDGVGDIILVDPDWRLPTSGSRVGRAELRSGKADALIHTFTGQSEFEPIGRAVWLGDADGDGRDDLCFVHAGEGIPSTGVSIHSGRAPFRLLHRIRSPRLSDSFGMATIGPGDVDADGCADVALFDFQDVVSFPDAKIFVYSGRTGGLLHTWSPPNRPTGYGSWLARVGDVDGDGHADVCIYSVDPTPNEILVRSGRDGSSIASVVDKSGLFFGAGDLDGDDIEDVLTSNWQHSNVVPFRVVRAWSFRDDSIEVFGRGCAPPGAVVPRIGATRTAKLGTSFEVHVSRSEPQRSAWLMIGVSASRWGGVPLPFDLGLFGHPGCAVLTSIDDVVRTTTIGVPGNGHATVVLPIPATPGLLGARFFLQWAVPDPPRLTLTRALGCTIE